MMNYTEEIEKICSGICERYRDEWTGEVMYIWNTSDYGDIEDYFSADADMLEWVREMERERVPLLLTVILHPSSKWAEYAIGIWNRDVGYKYDNRNFEMDDYEGVLDFFREYKEKYFRR